MGSRDYWGIAAQMNWAVANDRGKYFQAESCTAEAGKKSGGIW